MSNHNILIIFNAASIALDHVKRQKSTETFSVHSHSFCQKLNKRSHKHKNHKSITLLLEFTKLFYKPFANQTEQYIICIT